MTQAISVLGMTAVSVCQGLAAEEQRASPALPPWEPAADQAVAATLFGFRVLGERGAPEQPELDQYGLPMDLGDHAGSAVSAAGDFNGDGVDDLAIAAPGARPGGRLRCGAVYVVFGRPDGVFPMRIDLGGDFGGLVFESLNEYDDFGSSLASADFNGDGRDDLVVGTVGLGESGGAYVLFGGHEVASLADLDGTDGLRIDGWLPGSELGAVVAGVGDVNHDGVDDIALASRWSAPQRRVGEVVVLFGRGPDADPFPAVIELGALDGVEGFRVVGSQPGDAVGASVAGGHDVNGDGIDDLVIGAVGLDGEDRRSAGAAAIIFGRDVAGSGGFPGMQWLDRIGEGAGVLISGPREWANLGSSVAVAGDMDGDGLAEVVIGAEGQPRRPRTREDLARWAKEKPPEAAFVLTGRRDWPTAIDLVDGGPAQAATTRLLGGSPSDIAGLGDLDGDGLSDLGVALPNGIKGIGVGIVLGRPGPLPATIDLSIPDAGAGVWLSATRRTANARAVAPAGDINGDGYPDLLLGDGMSDPNGREGAGQALVLFGRPFRRAADGDPPR